MSRARLLPLLATATLAAFLAVAAAGDEPLAATAGEDLPAAAAASDDGADPLFVDAVEVNVVNVDVYVTDADDKPVGDLVADDFELLEDGRPVAVSNFFAVDNGVPRGAGLGPTEPLVAPGRPRLGLEPIAVPEDQQLYVVLYFDNLFLKPFSRNRVLAGVRDFLDRRLEPGDRVMVASFDKSLHVRQPFTDDRSLIGEQLTAIETLSAFAEGRDTERKETLRLIDNAEDVFSAQALVSAAAEAEYFELQTSVDALKELVMSLGGLPGRKALLYVSNGIPLRAGEDLFYLLDQKFGVGKQSGLLQASRFNAGRWFRDLAAQANANRVAFYTLDAAGLRSHQSLSAEHGGASTGGSRLAADAVRLDNLQTPLQMLAADTGGLSAFNTNNVRGALERLTADLRSYYSLGYQPVHGGDGRYHSIEVRLKTKRRGLTVRHRAGYRDKSSETRVAEATLASLLHGVEANPLEVELVFGRAQEAEDRRFLVPVEVRIPIAKLTLVPLEGVHRAKLRVSLAVVDERQALSSVEQTPIPLAIPQADLEKAMTQRFTYEAKLLMRAGEQTIAVGVRDELAGVTTYVRRHLAVPR